MPTGATSVSEGASHRMMMDEPETVTNLLLDWLRYDSSG